MIYDFFAENNQYEQDKNVSCERIIMNDSLSIENHTVKTKKLKTNNYLCYNYGTGNSQTPAIVLIFKR